MALNIRALAGTGARIGLALAGNAKVAITLKLGFTTGAVYNPLTDANTDAENASVETEGLRYQDRRKLEASRQVQDESVQTYAHTYMIEGVNVPEGQTIAPGDVIEEAGASWTVINASLDPGGGAWIVDVRR